MKIPYELMTFLLCLELFNEGNICLARKQKIKISATYLLRICEKATQFEKYPPCFRRSLSENKKSG